MSASKFNVAKSELEHRREVNKHSRLGVRIKEMAAYIKFDGIDGESTADGNDKWSELLMSNMHLHKTGAGEVGAARRRGTPIVEDIRCEKLLDKASPKIAEAVLSGKIFKTVDIHYKTSVSDDSRQTYLKVELKDVMVTSYSISGGNQEKPIESFSLNFGEIKTTYTELDNAGGKKGDVSYGWDVEKGKKV